MIQIAYDKDLREKILNKSDNINSVDVNLFQIALTQKNAGQFNHHQINVKNIICYNEDKKDRCEIVFEYYHLARQNFVQSYIYMSERLAGSSHCYNYRFI